MWATAVISFFLAVMSLSSVRVIKLLLLSVMKTRKKTYIELEVACKERLARL